MAIDKTGQKGQTRVEGTLLEQGLWFEAITASVTLDAADVGKVLLAKKAGLVFTLPATATGLKFLVVYDGPDDGVGTCQIKPNDNDKILGVDFAGDEKDTIDLTFGKPGDLVEVAYSNADGYFVTKIAGNWVTTPVT